MKIQARIFLILITGLFACVAISFVFKQVVTAKRKDLLTKQFQDTKNISVPNTMEIDMGDLKSCTSDYSVWDQLVDFIHTKDSVWAKRELEVALFNHPFDYVCVVDSMASQIYFVSKDKQDSASSFSIPQQILNTKLSADHFLHFYSKQNDKIIEIQAGPVQPTNDADRITTPHGYLMIARIINDNYIAHLHKIAPEINFALVNDNIPVTESINTDNTSIHYGVALDDINGRRLASIATSRSFPDLNIFSRDLNRYLIAFIAVVAAFCLGFFFLIRALVITPIASISRALHLKDASGIAGLSKSKTEYGLLSTLVIDSFSQNEILAREVEVRKKSEEALKAALAEKETAINEKLIAEQAAHAKSQFLSTMSHEIRTPINGVIGIANLLMEESLTERQMEYVSTLNFSAQHLLSLVSDILDFSKIEAGSLHFEKISFNLEKLCQHTFDLFKNKAAEKNIEYRFVSAPMKDHSLYGDSTRLSQVITNLISNAIKFTEKGSVVFSYEIEQTDNNQSRIIFKVQDTGIGIPENKIGKIFESFEQADDSVTRRYGGTGLGLTISKKIVEMQGGVMKVESVPGKGSAFIFTLTFDNHVYSDQSLYEQAVENTARKELPGMKILVAEDNPVNAMVLTRFLTKWKIESSVANDGAIALSMLDKDDYDLVLMDLQMPNMDGMEATKIIRQSDTEKIKSLTVVAFTADALVDTHRKLVEIGFDHCITKPFNPDQLFKYLEKQYLKAS